MNFKKTDINYAMNYPRCEVYDQSYTISIYLLLWFNSTYVKNVIHCSIFKSPFIKNKKKKKKKYLKSLKLNFKWVNKSSKSELENAQ